MASFRTHISVAVIGSATASVLCVQAGMVSQPQGLILLFLGALAGILPDVDSDHSVPTRILFKILSAAFTLLVLLYFEGQMSFIYLLALGLAGALSVHYVLYPLFASVTVHRGLFHSVPAALILGLSTAGICLYLFHWTLHLAWLAACFAAGGYLLHLLLDEIYSVNFIGQTLKASFGSALTLFSISSWISYSLLYLLVVAGFYILPLPQLLIF